MRPSDWNNMTWVERNSWFYFNSLKFKVSERLATEVKKLREQAHLPMEIPWPAGVVVIDDPSGWIRVQQPKTNYETGSRLSQHPNIRTQAPLSWESYILMDGEVVVCARLESSMPGTNIFTIFADNPPDERIRPRTIGQIKTRLLIPDWLLDLVVPDKQQQTAFRILGTEQEADEMKCRILANYYRSPSA